LLLLLAITALVVAARRHRYLPVGWFWFLGTLVPMIGLVQVGRQAMADRYAYLPFVGLFIMICWGLGDCAKRVHIPVAWQAGISVAALLALATGTHRQISFWGDNVRLWTHTVQVTNRNYLAEDNLGRALEAEGNRQDAILHYARSVEFDPSYVFAHIHVGTCLQLQGDLQGALQQYQEVISLTQNDIAHYAEARHRIFANMASAYGGLGNFVRARESLESAVGLNRDSPEEWTNLGILALKTDDVDRAVAAFSQAIKIQPSQRRYELLAWALQQAGRPQEAQAAMQRAASLPGDTSSQ
jgi:tetratricopeptide (TPR) repeat protein